MIYKNFSSEVLKELYYATIVSWFALNFEKPEKQDFCFCLGSFRQFVFFELCFCSLISACTETLVFQFFLYKFFSNCFFCTLFFCRHLAFGEASQQSCLLFCILLYIPKSCNVRFTRFAFWIVVFFRLCYHCQFYW